MRKSIVICIIFLFTSCLREKSDVNADYIINKFQKGTDSTFKRLNNYNGKLQCTFTKYFGSVYKMTALYSNKKLRTIKGQIQDRTYGHYFDFYNNGKIKSYYYYLGNGRNYSFSREYSIEGKLLSSKGNIFVDHIIDDKDSIDLFFTNVFHDSIQVFVLYKKFSEISVRLKQSSMQPMLLEGRLPLRDSVLQLRINSVEKNSKISQVQFDTLKLN